MTDHDKNDEAAVLTADIVLLHPTDAGLRVLVIKRKWEPFQGLWALPGGMVNKGEELVDAAVRELGEETSIYLQASDLIEFASRHTVGRDPRGRFVTFAFLGFVTDSVAATAKAADDAAELAWIPLSDEPDLAFDHKGLVDAAAQRARAELANSPELQNKDWTR